METLADLGIGKVGRIAAVDWSALTQPEGRRLRELGLFEGATVEVLHRGSLFARDPLAVRIARMRIILRRRQARCVSVSLDAPEPAPAP